MTGPPEQNFCSFASHAYSAGYAAHGEIGLQLEQFKRHLRSISEKHLGECPSDGTCLRFLHTLYTTDLYLTIACSQHSETGWKQFVRAYQKYISDLARLFSHAGAAHELAADILADLFMPNESGLSRMTLFDGRQSLATWLRILIRWRAINHGRLKWNSFERLACVQDVADASSLRRLDAAIRANRYQAILGECFRVANDSLTERERLLLLMRYEQGLRVLEIASVLGVQPTTVTRQIKRCEHKLQKKTTSVLAVNYHFGPHAIKECLQDILENPAHSLLHYLTDSLDEGRILVSKGA